MGEERLGSKSNGRTCGGETSLENLVLRHYRMVLVGAVAISLR
jgi:hypothetical protein